MASAILKEEKKEDGDGSSKVDMPEINKEEEYEAQFFRFAPKALLDSVYNCMFGTLGKNFQKLKENITENAGGVISDDELQDKVGIIQCGMISQMNGRFLVLERYALSQIFTIPGNVILPEDEIHEDPRLETINESELDTDIEELERRLATLRFMNAKMAEELQEIEMVREVQNIAKERLEQALDLGQQLETRCREDEEEIMAMGEIFQAD